MMRDWLTKDLAVLQATHQLRQMRVIEGSQGRLIKIEGHQFINFCSNNYLGLADDARLIAAADEEMKVNGFGSGASRLVCGNMKAHESLEKEMALLKKQESALLFNSGYSANTGVIPALVGRDDTVFSDKLNHASIVDGIILSRATLKRYPHGDMQALEHDLKSAPSTGRRMIVTDTVFSMDGDVADLSSIVDLAKRYDAIVYVDEAHALGVLGAKGAGLVEELGLEQDIDVQMGTLSKSAGCFGAYVAGSKALRDYLINHARSFIYTTGMPSALAAAGLRAIEIIKGPEGQERRQQLNKKSRYVSEALEKLGFNTLQSTTPIIPVVVGDAAKALDMSARLMEQGIYVSAIRPPTVPLHQARLRITVMATHTQEDIDYLLARMKGL